MQKDTRQKNYWQDCIRIDTNRLCLMGLLIALQILLSRITAINLGNWLRISFGFLPIAVAGYFLGPVGAILVAGVSDVLGTIFQGQAIVFGLTVTAIVGGGIYGFFFYRQKMHWIRIAICLLVVSLVCHFFLNTYFLARNGFVPLSNGQDWPAVIRQLVLPIYPEGANLPAWISVCNRFIKQVVVWPVNTVMLFYLMKAIEHMPKSIIKR